MKLEVSASGSVVTIEANERDGPWVRPRNHRDVVETEMELLRAPATSTE